MSRLPGYGGITARNRYQNLSPNYLKRRKIKTDSSSEIYKTCKGNVQTIHIIKNKYKENQNEESNINRTNTNKDMGR